MGFSPCIPDLFKLKTVFKRQHSACNIQRILKLVRKSLPETKVWLFALFELIKHFAEFFPINLTHFNTFWKIPIFINQFWHFCHRQRWFLYRTRYRFQSVNKFSFRQVFMVFTSSFFSFDFWQLFYVVQYQIYLVQTCSFLHWLFLSVSWTFCHSSTMAKISH